MECGCGLHSIAAGLLGAIEGFVRRLNHQLGFLHPCGRFGDSNTDSYGEFAAGAARGLTVISRF